MAHYAFLNENNIVTEVISGRDEWEEVDGITDWEQAYSDVRGQVCKRTSYNGKIRFNYAGIGYTYDPIDDAFIAPMQLLRMIVPMMLQVTLLVPLFAS